MAHLGTELLSLCRSVTEDGRLLPEELTSLRQWLDDAAAADMPALQHLRLVIGRVLADDSWALLAQTDVPKETRDYVMLIFAASVIGEDPKLFGFDFDRPLDSKAAARRRS